MPLAALSRLLLLTTLCLNFPVLGRAQTEVEDETEVVSTSLPRCAPEQVAMRSERMERIESLVEEAIEAGKMPGCVITVGRRGHVVYHRAFGHRQLEPESLPMKDDTVFDLASLTKPIATATCAMMLIEQGKLRLNDRVSAYLPDFANGGKENATSCIF